MKFSVFVAGVYLAGLGLAAPAPGNDARGLQHVNGKAASTLVPKVPQNDLEKRKSSKKTSHAASQPKTTAASKTTKTSTSSIKTSSSTTTSSVKTSSSTITSSVKTSSSTTSSSSSTIASTTSKTSSSSVVSSSSTARSSSSASSSASSTASSASTSGSSSSVSSAASSASTSGSSSASTGSQTTSGTLTSLSSTLTSTATLSTSTGHSNSTARITSKTRTSHITGSSSSLTSTVTSSSNGTVTGKPHNTLSTATTGLSSTMTTSSNYTAHITTSASFSTITSSSNSTGHITSSTVSASTTSNSTVTSCRRATSKATSTGSASTRRRRGGNDDGTSDPGAACELETVLDFGNGWRTPTEQEYNDAQPHLPGPFGSYEFKPYFAALENGDRGKTDCPNPPKFAKPITDEVKAYNAEQFTLRTATILTKEFSTGPGAMKSVGANAAMFYSQVGGHDKERDWVRAQGKAWRFLPDHWVDGDATAWLNGAQKCTGMVPGISSGMALLAEGDVNVLLSGVKFKLAETPVWDKKQPTQQSGKVGNTIWEDWEWPTLLKKNKDACRIWRWDITTGKPDLLAVRTGMGKRCPDTYDAKPQGVLRKSYDVPSNAAVPGLVLPEPVVP